VQLVIPIVFLGLLASLSPSTLVVFILLLATTRALVNAFAFLIGWAISLTVVFAISWAIGTALAAQQRTGSRTAVDIVEILVGLALGALGAWEWRRRNVPRVGSGVSKGLAVRLQDLRPWQAAIVGALKQPWTLTAAAALVVVRTDSRLIVDLIAFLVFTAVSTATVAGMFVYSARRPTQAQRYLSDLRARLVRAGPSILAVIALAVGVYLVVDGITGVLRS
jgi:Sap, sulfolipid-1-addressing protein